MCLNCHSLTAVVCCDIQECCPIVAGALIYLFPEAFFKLAVEGHRDTGRDFRCWFLHSDRDTLQGREETSCMRAVAYFNRKQNKGAVSWVLRQCS